MEETMEKGNLDRLAAVRNSLDKGMTAEDLKFSVVNHNPALQHAEVTFSNGYTLSVVKNLNNHSLYEALVKDEHGEIAKTDITSDVIYADTDKELTEIMKKTSMLDKDGKLPKEVSQGRNVSNFSQSFRNSSPKVY